MGAVRAPLRCGALVDNLRRLSLSWCCLPLLDLRLRRNGLRLGLRLLHLLRLLLLLLLLLLFSVVDSTRRNVETLVDLLRDRRDLGSELLLNAIEVEAILVRDEVDGETQVSETAGTTYAVEVRFRVLREVEVDDDVNGLNIYTTGEEVGADKVAANTLAEVVEDAVTVRLEHLGMRVET